LFLFGYWPIKIGPITLQEALRIIEFDVLKVEAYTGQEEGLVFLFTTKRDVGAMFTKLGQFGWKYDTMIWAGSLDQNRLQPVVFEDRLIYGLLEKADDKKILANGVRAEMIKLDFFPIVVIEEYGLQNSWVWYVKDPPVGSVLVELVDTNTGEVIEESELDVGDD